MQENLNYTRLSNNPLNSLENLEIESLKDLKNDLLNDFILSNNIITRILLFLYHKKSNKYGSMTLFIFSIIEKYFI